MNCALTNNVFFLILFDIEYTICEVDVNHSGDIVINQSVRLLSHMIYKYTYLECSLTLGDTVLENDERFSTFALLGQNLLIASNGESFLYAIHTKY